MNLSLFKESLSASQPPDDISDYLKALWYDAHNNWDKAHKIIQEIDDKNASRIHAYLHRKEGDTFNAKYWYNKAGIHMPVYSTDEEWEQIIIDLL